MISRCCADASLSDSHIVILHSRDFKKLATFYLVYSRLGHYKHKCTKIRHVARRGISFGRRLERLEFLAEYYSNF